ncbi:hypothetical protein PCL_11409 [Purpureocillium lilacinum]|uniref:MATE efflux family protein subfamily n=1 Tax=Purpureocillium lilacinum TaxID=33203 RepID=A0A2U3E9Y6_PURLI|nr:hypothetical protein PCL_11409 [Purpureocillium lilacinum]
MALPCRVRPTQDGENDEHPAVLDEEPTEETPLVGSSDSCNTSKWPYCVSERSMEGNTEQSEADPHDRDSWQHESKTIICYAAPLVITFLLQYSIDVSSIFVAGRLGKVELGAVSLANMSASITCFAAFQGLATSLDTLCAQAFGSGQRQLVGLYCQRMMMFLLCLSVPIAILWYASEPVLLKIVPDTNTAHLCSLYLRVLVFAIPGYAAFETGKRFLQAQGLFSATTYILLIGAPFNAILMWLLVWKLELGFVGAPISVAMTRTLLPVLLVLYVRYSKGSQCWGGFTKRAFANFRSMIRLSLPGMVMVEAEWLVFEIITLLSTRFGIEYLAAQSIIFTLTTLSYQILFSLSIAASTRVARLIGAGRVKDARLAAKVAVITSCLSTLPISLAWLTLRHKLPYMFTEDERVAGLVTQILPVIAVMVLFDGLGAVAHGLLRGIGRQSIGGPASLVAYYAVSLPLALGIGIGLDWRIEGLWLGCTIGLVVVSFIEYAYLLMADWQKAVLEAASRNSAG